MQIENYEPTRRDKLRAAAHFSTPEGKRRLARYMDEAHLYIEGRIRNEGYQLPPDEMAEHEKWRANHPELFCHSHK